MSSGQACGESLERDCQWKSELGSLAMTWSKGPAPPPAAKGTEELAMKALVRGKGSVVNERDAVEGEGDDRNRKG